MLSSAVRNATMGMRSPLRGISTRGDLRVLQVMQIPAGLADESGLGHVGTLVSTAHMMSAGSLRDS
jgi:hypothetical protein